MALGLKGGFVVDTRATALDPIKNGVFTVDTNAVRLEAYGLANADEAVVQILVGPDSDNSLWADLYLAGKKVALNATNSQTIIVLGGKYRVHYAGSAEIAVYYEYDAASLDKNVFYNYQQPAVSVSGGGGSGFTLTTEDTEGVHLSYTGDTTAGTLSANAWPSADSTNILSLKPDGIYVPDQAFQMAWTAENADFAVSATENNAYTVTAASETTVTGDLPSPALVTNKLYLVLAKGLGTVHLIANGGSGTINGVSTPVTVPSGAAIWLFSNGVDDWIGVLGASIV